MLQSYVQSLWESHSINGFNKISDTSLDFEIVTQSNLARHGADESQNMVLLYYRVLRHRQVRVN